MIYPKPYSIYLRGTIGFHRGVGGVGYCTIPLLLGSRQALKSFKLLGASRAEEKFSRLRPQNLRLGVVHDLGFRIEA